jgi:hypothetical protein
MTVSTRQSSLNLRAALAKLAALRQPPVQQEFWSTFTAGQTTVALPTGWTVMSVRGISTNYRPGAGYDYTTSFDGFVWTVTFATSPGAVSICVNGERRL